MRFPRFGIDSWLLPLYTGIGNGKGGSIMQVAIDRFGRLVLPKAIRDDFGLLPGDLLDAEEQKDVIVLRPSGRADAMRSHGRVLVFGGKAEGNLADVQTQLRRERLDRAGGMKGIQ